MLGTEGAERGTCGSYSRRAVAPANKVPDLWASIDSGADWLRADSPVPFNETAPSDYSMQVGDRQAMLKIDDLGGPFVGLQR